MNTAQKNEIEQILNQANEKQNHKIFLTSDLFFQVTLSYTRDLESRNSKTEIMVEPFLKCEGKTPCFVGLENHEVFVDPSSEITLKKDNPFKPFVEHSSFERKIELKKTAHESLDYVMKKSDFADSLLGMKISNNTKQKIEKFEKRATATKAEVFQFVSDAKIALAENYMAKDKTLDEKTL